MKTTAPLWAIVKAVLPREDLSPVAKLVLFAIVERMGEGKDKSWPGYMRLAKDTGCSRRAVIYAVENLVEQHMIEVTRGRKAESGKRGTSNRYRLGSGAKIALQRCKDCTTTSAKIAPPAVQNLHPNILREHTNKHAKEHARARGSSNGVVGGTFNLRSNERYKHLREETRK